MNKAARIKIIKKHSLMQQVIIKYLDEKLSFENFYADNTKRDRHQ